MLVEVENNGIRHGESVQVLDRLKVLIIRCPTVSGHYPGWVKRITKKKLHL
jgi:hypothetical protein